MSFTISSFTNSFRNIFTKNNDSETKITVLSSQDEKITDFVPERIRRSPGHTNLSQISEEPEWYHD